VHRELEGSVVVITGASSGLGRATAMAFAEEGAHLVLAARSAEPLTALAECCHRRGRRAIAVPTDVGDHRQVRALVDAAVEEYGHIDTWVNDAAVLLAGVYGDESAEEVERLVRTNVGGAAFGARAAIAQFRRQGHGVLIDVSSLLGVVANPLVPVYVMSKFAVRGLSLSLHHLVRRWPGIRVCVVLPGPIDTPIFDRAANHTGRKLRAIPPAIAPERVAATIVSCARRPRRQATTGFTGHAILTAHRLAPRLTEWAVARASAALVVQRRPGEDSTGALFDAEAGGAVHGGWRRGEWRRAIGSWVGARSTRRAPQ
jgi:NAD(P)-dependent dehydrogenase (short-subunit alcohol dehydrogenase family)